MLISLQALHFKKMLKTAGHEKKVKKVKVKETEVEPYKEAYEVSLHSEREGRSTMLTRIGCYGQAQGGLRAQGAVARSQASVMNEGRSARHWFHKLPVDLKAGPG